MVSTHLDNLFQINCGGIKTGIKCRPCSSHTVCAISHGSRLLLSGSTLVDITREIAVAAGENEKKRPKFTKNE